MTDAKPARPTSEKAIYKTVIDAPIETVWNTLVKTDDVLPFFFGSICETKGMKPGNGMRMVSKDRKFAAVVGEILEFSPPHRYSHTMAFTQYPDDPPSTVLYELKELPNGSTEFSLITTNVPTGTKSEKYMAQGGPFIVDNLKKLVETGKPAFSGAMVMMLNPLMGLMTPKICRVENWPLR